VRYIQPPVRLEVKGRNVEVSDELRAYVEEKLGRLERLLRRDARLEVELAVERNPSIAASQVAEATVWSKGPVLRARESSSDMRASIDLLVGKLERQAERAREKRRSRSTRAAGGPPESAPRHESRPAIVKTKRFPIKPMTADEAVLQLELVGHDFFVFRNVDTEDVNVVYRRRHGDYGLIEPAGP
jgi:putative sigma-54 modulation protein